MKYILVFFSSLFLFSCSEQSQKKEEFTEGTVKQEGRADSCLCVDLLVDSTGFHSKGGKAYTGVCTDYYPGSEDKYIEKNLLDGYLHGTVVYYSRSGDELMKEMYQKGVKRQSGDTDFLVCDCTDLEKVTNADPQLPNRYFLDEIPYTGRCQQFFPETNQMSVESHYKKGLLDGYTSYYDKQGNTLYIEEYQMGTLVNILHQ